MAVRVEWLAVQNGDPIGPHSYRKDFDECANPLRAATGHHDISPNMDSILPSPFTFTAAFLELCTHTMIAITGR